MPRKPDLSLIGQTYNNLKVDKLTKANSYMMLAKIKYYEARNNPHYKAYQLDNARWRISYDVYNEIVKEIIAVVYKDTNTKTLYGFPVDICDGEGILKLYVEV